MANDVYQRLMGEAKSNRRKLSLTAINDTCKEQRASGYTDFSIAAVSRAGRARGVPSAQSIRNDSGAVYRELINAWKERYSCSIAKVKNNEREWVDKIDDPALRYLALELLAKNKSLEAELQLFRSVTVLEIDLRKKTDKDESDVPQLDLTDSEYRSLMSATDEVKLRKFGLQIVSRGAVVSENNSVVFERGFVSAIKKIVTWYERL